MAPLTMRIHQRCNVIHRASLARTAWAGAAAGTAGSIIGVVCYRPDDRLCLFYQPVGAPPP